jgi:hypothetical protein
VLHEMLWERGKDYFMASSVLRGAIGEIDRQLEMARDVLRQMEAEIGHTGYQGGGWENPSEVSAGPAAKAAALTYSYTCTDLAAIPASPFEGIANFTFQRRNTKTPPEKIDGYSADLTDMTIYPSHEFLLTREQMDLAEAWEQAKSRC